MGFAQLAVGAIGAVQVAQQGAIGKYNQAVANRNAQVAEQEAQRLEQQLEFDLARFDQQFAQLQGQTKTNSICPDKFTKCHISSLRPRNGSPWLATGSYFVRTEPCPPLSFLNRI